MKNISFENGKKIDTENFLV